MTRLLICGGQNFHDVEYAVEKLNRLHAQRPISYVITGGAKGVDEIGELWRQELNLDGKVFRAQWDLHGRKAGPLRNTEMLEKGRPNLVIAFPGGKETDHLILISRKAHVEVIAYRGVYFTKEDPEWNFLSNFYAAEQIDEDGVVWPTNEHYFQSRKNLTETVRSFVLQSVTPNEAKRRGRQIAMRADWDEVKNAEMLGGLRLKFQPDTELTRRLLSSGDRYLCEYTTWGDTYWGVNTSYQGMNWLGRLLMQRRAELKEQP